MRERTTWQNKVHTTPRQAATSRRADIYDMNMEKGRHQPSPVEYENGDPDKWAETPTTNKNVEAEYEGGHVKRNEIGLGEFRDDTWKHKDSDQWNGGGKYDNQRQAAERKAAGVERIARTMLRTNDESQIERLALDLMGMPAVLVEKTVARIHAASPEALPEENRFRRAYACTKLAAQMIGEDAPEETLERLAATVMRIDDPTLTSILGQVARYAAEAEEAPESAPMSEEAPESGKAAAEKDAAPESEKKPVAAEAAPKSEKKAAAEEAAPESAPPSSGPDSKEACWGSDEKSMMAAMLKEDSKMAAEDAAPESAPESEGPASSKEPEAVAAMAGKLPEFGDEEHSPDSVRGSDLHKHASVLDALFADDPEVKAQREIQAASRGASNFNVGRTASAGAKKLGAVRKSDKISGDDLLDAIWERP